MNLTEEEIKLLLSDKKFCRNKEAYCLGDTLEEAAEVCRILMQQAQEEAEAE